MSHTRSISRFGKHRQDRTKSPEERHKIQLQNERNRIPDITRDRMKKAQEKRDRKKQKVQDVYVIDLTSPAELTEGNVVFVEGMYVGYENGSEMLGKQ